MELMGLYEIAQLAGVSPQAVANWIQRKDDFPKPVAQLASGQIWDGKAIKRWLDASRGDTGEGRALKLIKGREYTHAEVCSLGGEPQSYLPQKDGAIICGRFTKDMNDQSPYVVLVGKGPRIVAKAEALAEQKGPIPVFVKEGTDRWRYHGQMRLKRYDTNLEVIRKSAAGTGRQDVVGVLTFEDA